MLASRNYFKVLLFIAGMAALAACGSGTQSVTAAGEAPSVRQIDHRVLADDVSSFVDAESFTVQLATNSEELEVVIASLGLDRPEADFDEEIVLNFNIAESSSCRFLPVEGLLFDEETQRLYPDVQLDLPAIEVEGEEVVCNDDDNPHGIVMAVPRDALPEGDFNIWVEERDPPGCCSENLLRIEAGELATSTVAPIDAAADGSVEVLTHDSDDGLDALGSFTLQYDPELNCLYHDEADNNGEPGTGGRVTVIWPSGYSAMIDGDEVNVLDADGAVVARTNATFQIAGGSGPADGHCDSIGAWFANGGPIERN